VENSIQEAEHYCQENGLNFTPVRRKVLEILLQKNTAIGAYEILDLLREAGFKNQPPVAYRKYKEAGKSIKIRHLSPDCRDLLKEAGPYCEWEEDDPTYRIVRDDV
jgi:Fe2+ or Zn2+ uptake regulation protein